MALRSAKALLLSKLRSLTVETEGWDEMCAELEE